MPEDRTQLNTERIAALVEVLEQEGAVPSGTADELKNADQIGRADEVAQAHAQANGAGGGA